MGLRTAFWDDLGTQVRAFLADLQDPWRKESNFCVYSVGLYLEFNNQKAKQCIESIAVTFKNLVLKTRLLEVLCGCVYHI